MCMIATYPPLLRDIESRQLQYILQAGLNPRSFAAIGFGEMRFLRLRLTAAKIFYALSNGANAQISKSFAEKLKRHVDVHLPSYNKFKAAYDETAKKYPHPQSRFQRLDDHVLLCEFVGHISRAIPLCGEPTRSRLANTLARANLFTAPMGRCNGRVFYNHQGEQSGIILDDEIIRSLAQISLVLAKLIRREGNTLQWDIDFAAQRLRDDKTITEAGVAIIQSFLEFGTSRLAAPPPSNEREMDIMQLLTPLSFIWTIAHELGHVALGHLEDPRRREAALLEEVDIDELDNDLLHEVQADEYADYVTQAVSKSWRHNADVAYVVSGLVVRLYRSVYLAIAKKVAPTLSESSYDGVLRAFYRHPSPRERLEASLRRYSAVRSRETAFFLNMVFDHFDRQLDVRAIRLHRRWSTLADGLVTMSA